MKKYWLIKVIGKNEYSFIIYCDADNEHKAIGMALKNNLFSDRDDANYAVAEEADEIIIKVYKTCKCCYNLWSIKEAENGDVVQLGKVTAIFKELIGDGNYCRCYCSVFNGEFEIPSQEDDDNSYGCYPATPATKEQRDTLMKAMADAGYTFDFEHKELKKIEQNPVE